MGAVTFPRWGSARQDAGRGGRTGLEARAAASWRTGWTSTAPCWFCSVSVGALLGLLG